MKKFKYTEKEVQILAMALKMAVKQIRIAPYELDWFFYNGIINGGVVSNYSVYKN